MSVPPASIRFNNPGAMWGKGNKIATKWGSTAAPMLNDGLGQGNNIAFFPTKVRGACAQFDLWRTGYCNMTLAAAIRKWSGGNWSQPYADFLVRQTGISLDTTVTPGLLDSPAGLRLMKFQAQWEAGTAYPLSDTEWAQAQARVFSERAPMTPSQKKATSTAVIVGGAAAGAAKAAQSGSHWSVVLFIFLLGVILAGVSWVLIHQAHEVDTSPPPPPVVPEGHP